MYHLVPFQSPTEVYGSTVGQYVSTSDTHTVSLVETSHKQYAGDNVKCDYHDCYYRDCGCHEYGGMVSH